MWEFYLGKELVSSVLKQAAAQHLSWQTRSVAPLRVARFVYIHQSHSVCPQIICLGCCCFLWEGSVPF